MIPRRPAMAAGALTLIAAVGVTTGTPARAAGGTPGGPSTTTAPASPDTVRLQSQTPWVDATTNTILELKVATSVVQAPVAVRVVVNVYARVGSRSDFNRTLAPNFTGYLVGQPVVATLDTFHPDVQGVIDIKIPITNGTVRTPGEVRLPGSGVYPVSVDLRPRQGGAPYARLVTTVPFTASPVTGPRLGVAWVAPVYAPPPAPVATAQLSPADDARLTTLISALAAHTKVPVTLDASADTVEALAATDPGLVSTLGRSLDGREVLAGTWVPTPLPAMLQAGLADQASLSLTKGTDALNTDLGTAVAGRTWVQDGPVDAPTLTFLRGAQFDRVVLPPADLEPNPYRVTIARPFEVAGSDQTPIRAAVADSGLAAHFEQTPDPVLAAHQLLGDLATIYNDAPADQRGVVVVTPRSWAPDATFLDAFLGGLESSPLLAGMTVDDFFDQIPPIAGPGGGPAMQSLVTDAPTIHAESLGLYPDRQHQARQQLDSLTVALPGDTEIFPRLERILLEVPSADLFPADRAGRLNALNQMLRAEVGQIQLAGPRTITLTERKGRLPLNVLSGTDETVHVVLKIKSDKLSFPGVSSNGVATLPEVLHKGNNPLPDLTVAARTAGRFPITITITSPDGGLVFEQATFTVQSTALSGVGVVLSAGAAAFLLVWWGRHAWRSRRRRRRLHAKGTHSPGGDDTPERASVTASTP